MFSAALDGDSCHRSDAWVPAIIDHVGVIDGCSNCHDGLKAEGKDAAHLQSTSLCEACHTTACSGHLR